MRLLCFVAGGIGWTLMEYLLHRFAMHGMRGWGIASREHLKHHAIRGYYATTLQKGASMVAFSGMMLPVAWALLGPANGVAFALGLAATYLTYEFLHRRAHTHPPKNAYGRWLRKNHFLHHFRMPTKNHGVSIPVWDHVFGTFEPWDDVVVKVPRRYAMDWLIDSKGDLRPEFAADYVLVGDRPDSERQAELDRDAAFSNLAPAF